MTTIPPRPALPRLPPTAAPPPRGDADMDGRLLCWLRLPLPPPPLLPPLTERFRLPQKGDEDGSAAAVGLVGWDWRNAS